MLWRWTGEARALLVGPKKPGKIPWGLKPCRTCENVCVGGSPKSGAEIKEFCWAVIAKLGGKAKEGDKADWADEAEVGNEAN